MEKSKLGSNANVPVFTGSKKLPSRLSNNEYGEYQWGPGQFGKEKRVLYISFYASVLGAGAAVFLPVFLQTFKLPSEGRIRAIQFSSSFKAAIGGGPFLQKNTLLTIYQNFNPYYQPEGTSVQNANTQFNIWKSDQEGTKRIELSGAGLYVAAGVTVNCTMSIHTTIALNDTCTGDCVLEVEI
jgi:hypothetical protein